MLQELHSHIQEHQPNTCQISVLQDGNEIVMRHVASGANGSLISVFSPLGLCQTVTCGTL